MKTTVEFNSVATDALDHLSTRLEIPKADVLRAALSLYGYVVNEMSQGGQLGIAPAGTTTIENLIVVPGISPFPDKKVATG